LRKRVQIITGAEEVQLRIKNSYHEAGASPPS
jgi:hypothetical protein